MNLKIYIQQKIITKIYRIQANDSIICGHFCIEYTDFMLSGKSLLDYIYLFSPNEYEKDDTITLESKNY